ncbi:MAG: tetratricopeptide repeat protein [Polyangiaceae bacterium]
MRFILVASTAALVFCAPTGAFAQKHGGGGGGGSTKGAGNNTPSGKIVVEHNNGSTAALARSRAAGGDCKGALDAFDAALETSVDPELHRDRGICHEKLGNAYPAIDDYRFYLTARPNAQDADRIHDRLDALLADNGQAPADKSAQKAGKNDKKEDDKAKLSAGATTAPDEVHSDASATVSMGNAGTDNPDANAHSGKDIDTIDADEKHEAEAQASPLRKGKGFIIGPYFALRDFTKKGYGGSEAFGAAFRYSFGAPSSLVGEVGYSTINSTGTDAALGGLMLFGGYEARLALDPRYNNAIIFQGGLGYERLSQGASGLVASIVLPRGRLGFRHIFGSSIGLELGLDAGYGFVHVLGVEGDGADSGSFMIGGSIALLIGF